MMLRFKEIREKNDLTQKDMAKILKISKSYYNFFETGERIIPLKRLNDFCNKFHVSMDYALGLNDKNIMTKGNYIINRELISNRIKEIRKYHKLTQKELAKLLNTSQSTISSYEKGKTLILTAFLYEICKKLNVSSDYIVGKTNTIKVII